MHVVNFNTLYQHLISNQQKKSNNLANRMGNSNSNHTTSNVTPLNNATNSSSLVLPRITTDGSSSFVQRSHFKENNQPQKQQDKMCAKIYENNKKHSLARKNSRLKNISLTNLNTHDKEEGARSSKPSMQTDFQSKLKYFSNNKKLIEESIEATICVQRALNVLCHHEILQSNQFNYLNAKNKRSLECKQKRYRNLQVREHKVIVSMGQSNDENEKGEVTKQSHSLHLRKAKSSIFQKSINPNRPSLRLDKR